MAPQQQVPTGEGIVPLPADNPQALLAELSQVELTCIAESGDLQGSLTTIQAPELASPEEVQELLLCLRDGTVLRLFLSGLIGQTGPLSGETSACLRAGFTGVDLRSMMLAGAAGEEEGQVMADSMTAFLLAMSCLNEDEWEIAAPSMGMASTDRETLQCVMRELNGPAGVAAALQPADGGPPLAFFAAAVGCGMSAVDLASITAPPTTTNGMSGGDVIAPISLEDPAAFAMELSATEQACVSETAEPQELALIMSTPELFPMETAALTQCFEDETLLRLFITGLIGLTGPLSVESSACIRGGMEGIDLRSMMMSGIEGDEQTAMVGSMSAYMLTLSCLNDEEWQAASAATGMDPGERENLQCVMEQLGGPEGMATALQSEDGSGIFAILGAALGCGLQLDMGASPGG